MNSMQQTSPAVNSLDETTPVLIVGGGLTGLSTALFLSWHGVRPLLVERHPDLLIHPRARGFTQRTVELFRQVGLEPAIRAASFAGGDDFQWVAVRAETLAGEHEPAEEAEEGRRDGAPQPRAIRPPSTRTSWRSSCDARRRSSAPTSASRPSWSPASRMRPESPPS